jgi:hypothetical protein
MYHVWHLMAHFSFTTAITYNMYHVWHLMAHFSFTTAITYNMYHVWHLLAYFSRNQAIVQWIILTRVEIYLYMYRGLCEPLVFIVLVMLGHCGSMFIYFLYLIVSGIHSTEIRKFSVEFYLINRKRCRNLLTHIKCTILTWCSPHNQFTEKIH